MENPVVWCPDMADTKDVKGNIYGIDSCYHYAESSCDALINNTDISTLHSLDSCYSTTGIEYVQFSSAVLTPGMTMKYTCKTNLCSCFNGS